MRQTWIRGLCCGLGLLGLLLFAVPICFGVGGNIGSITGLGVSLLLLGLGFGWIRLSGIPRWIRRGLGVLLAGILLLTCILTGLMWHAAAKEPEDPAVVIVLGCMIYGDQPSLALRERLDAAITYLSDHEDTVCILSGGQGADEAVSEAQVMEQYLTARGIDPARLVLEDQSTSTRENLLFSKAILEERGWPDRVAVVTNEFHEYRALYIASAVGMEAAAVPASTAWWLLPTYYVRELYGILFEWVRTTGGSIRL